MAKSLERFSIARAADGFLVTIEDDSGDTVEMTATEDQIDLMIEELDRVLDDDSDEAALIDDEDPADREEDE
jgi:hypothetical protein